MLVRLETDSRRKACRLLSLELLGTDGWCARYDSRPLEKANEPRGRAESERSRRAWRDGDCDGVGCGRAGGVWRERWAFRVARWVSRSAISSSSLVEEGDWVLIGELEVIEA